MAEIVRIKKLHPEGYGVGTLSSGREAHVWGALADELVEVSLTKRKRGATLCVAEKIIELCKKAPHNAIIHTQAK